MCVSDMLWFNKKQLTYLLSWEAYPSCHPTNSVKALKETQSNWPNFFSICHRMCDRGMVLPSLVYSFTIRSIRFKQFHQQMTNGRLQTYTHTRLTALCPRLPGWASTKKEKPIWILLKQETVSGSGIHWAKCKSAPRSSQITMPVPHHSIFYRLHSTTEGKHISTLSLLLKGVHSTPRTGWHMLLINCIATTQEAILFISQNSIKHIVKYVRISVKIQNFQINYFLSRFLVSIPLHSLQQAEMENWKAHTTKTTTTIVLRPLQMSTFISWHLQFLRTGGFCWCKVLLPACPCWQQPAHTD